MEIKLLKNILQFLQFTENIKITKQIDEQGTLLSLEVDKKDMPLLIGKKGININAIKLLMKLNGKRNNKIINLKILE